MKIICIRAFSPSPVYGGGLGRAIVHTQSFLTLPCLRGRAGEGAAFRIAADVQIYCFAPIPAFPRALRKGR
mgnify:CR=1 FL=1